MVALLPRWERGEGAWTAILLAAAAASIGLVGSRLFGVPSLVTVFAVPLGVIVGPAAAWGLAIGWLLRDLATGVLGPSSVVHALADGALVLLGAVLWRGRSLPGREVTRSALAKAELLVLVAFTAAVGSASLLVWGLTLVGNTSAVALGPGLIVHRVLPSTVLVLPALAALSVLPWSASPKRRMPVDGDGSSSPVPVGVVAGVAAVFTTWFGGVLVHDVLHRDIASVLGAETQLLTLVPDLLHGPLTFAVGPHARTIQLLGGVTAGVLVLFLLYPELP